MNLFALTILICTAGGDCTPVHRAETYTTMAECLDAAIFAFRHVSPEFQLMTQTIKCDRAE